MRLSERLFRQCHVRTSVLTGYAPNSILSIILRPGGWVAQSMWSGLRRLCGGSDSDYNTNLSSTSTELANWN